MLKGVNKMKYHWHAFQFRYNEMLLNDCLSEEIRIKLQGKASYHERCAVSLLVKI